MMYIGCSGVYMYCQEGFASFSSLAIKMISDKGDSKKKKKKINK